MGISITEVPGVGERLAKSLAKLSIVTKRDFIFCFPRSYEDRRHIPLIRQLPFGESVLALAEIESVDERKVKGRLSIVECLVKDSSGYLIATWFNQAYLMKLFKPGMRVLLKGKIEKTLFDPIPKLAVSDFESFRSERDLQEAIGCVIPIYPLTQGVYQYQMRHIATQLLKVKPYPISDPTPAYLKKKHGLLELNQAIYELHFPSQESLYKQAHRRIVFDEFFYFQLRLGRKRSVHQHEHMARALAIQGPILLAYLSRLPYALTRDQQAAIDAVKHDVATDVSMNRLLQGDVGAGKTDVAIAALLMAIDTGLTGALMVPTEILAEQHYLKLQQRLIPLGVTCLLLKGKQRKRERASILTVLQSGHPVIVIGTHALIQDTVTFSNLGLVVIDEQHRFGVMQRMTLRQKGYAPHCLFMTATPIPRSFMLTCFGDLDKTIISMVPPGRIPPKTYFIKPHSLEKVLLKCKDYLDLGQQLFVVYPLIEESEKLDLQSAIEGWTFLQGFYPQFSVGLLHGKMKGDEKAAIMADFKANKYQILVATTVIEVGIDVPNATQMIIMDAHRFGLSQLHQLRGRIGRGREASFCYLVAEPKTDSSKKRLKAMVETTDGFKLAEYDLMIRGPGDMLGTRQAGMPSFILADLVRDESLLILARDEALALLEADPNLESPDHQGIKTVLQKRPDIIQGGALN